MPPLIRTLPNGLTLVVQPMPGQRLAALSALIHFGVRHEINRSDAGLRFLLAHSLLGGTRGRRREEIEQLAASIGGRLDVRVAEDFVEFSLVALKEHSDTVIHLMADLLLRPSFDEAEIERARQTTIAAQLSLLNEPRSLAYLTAKELIYGQKGYGFPPAGYARGVARVKREHLLRFYQAYFRASNIVLAFAGDVEPEDIFAQVSADFGGMPRGQVPQPPLPKPVTLSQNFSSVKQMRTDRAHLLTAFPTVGSEHPDAPALHLLAAVLGQGMDSRLFRAMRSQEVLSYHADAVYLPHLYAGELVFYIAVHPDAAERARSRLERLLLDVKDSALRQAQEKAFSERELQRAKAYLLNQRLLASESAAQRASLLAIEQLLGPSAAGVESFAQLIEKVRAEDVQRVAKKYLSHSATVLILPL